MDIKYCSFCGTLLKTKMFNNSERLYCEKCNFIHYKNPTVGVAVILFDENRLLLVKRNGSYNGLWCIPCGHVEWNETAREAAIREFKEETGLEVKIDHVFDVHSNFHDSQNHTVGIWFIGQRTGGNLKAGSDASDARFFSLNDLSESMMAFPTDIKICNALKSNRY